MNDARPEREFGLERGKVFPAYRARSLLNPARRLVQSARRTVAAMQLPSDAVVLELGCGPGFFSPSLLRAVPRGRVVLADLQAEMLSVASERVAGQPAVTWVQADASALPFPSESFDGVLIATMLGEVPDRGACLAEVRRVLRVDGEVTIAETRRDSDFIALDDLRELALTQRLAFVDRRGIGWQYTARFRRIAESS